MNNWINRGIALLDRCLGPVPTELNELDWKEAISNKNERLAQHLSAFANYSGGGYMAFGITNDAQLNNITSNGVDDIINRLGSIARTSVEPPVTIQHSIIEFRGHDLLLVYIQESEEKPVYVKKEAMFGCYKRSATQTVKMSEAEVRSILATTQGISFEEKIIIPSITTDEVIQLLDYDAYFRLSKKTLPDKKSGIVDILSNEEIIFNSKQDNTKWDITNLGAIAFAKDLRNFRILKRKSVRVVIYKGVSKIDAIKEQEGQKGYASGFEGLISFIMNQLPQNEIIEKALRQQVKMYPEKAIREFVANALIHQDFSVRGAGVTIEIFEDRIEITNPGIPLVDVNRFIDTAPKSRNETLASLLRRLNICEERGSGIDRAISEIEAFQLPAPKFIKGEDYTRVIVYSHKLLKDMDKEDRIRACYQHCVLQYVNNRPVNNQSVRTRFNIAEKNYPMASRIITETIDIGLIKPADEDSKSKRFATYIPFWA